MSIALQEPALLRAQAYINGAWVEADDGATCPVESPASGDVIAEVAKLGATETRRAILAASDAMQSWRQLAAKARAQILRRWFDLMTLHQEDLARILTLEQGKALAEARAEIAHGASYLEWFGEQAKRIDGEVIPGPGPDRRILCIRQPVGVVAAITPWNFPSAMITRKAAPALAAGCSIVIKPALETPLSALALAVLAERAGVPPGVLNVVVGDGEAVGGELTRHPLVRKVTFTGSTAVGKVLEAQCAATMKKTSMELGGNAPFIVFDDADLPAAVQGAMLAKYRNAGQTCVSANRILVQDTVHDAFVAGLVAVAADLAVGDGMCDDVQMGPLIHEKALQRVDSMVRASVGAGAHLVLGGERFAGGGSFYSPTILTGVTPEMAVFQNETFGPVASVVRFSTEQEVIALANQTEHGLAAYFYSRDLGRVWRVAEALECGMVGINDARLANEMAPFGGIKESGSGREGARHGMDDYTEIKYILMGGLD